MSPGRGPKVRRFSACTARFCSLALASAALPLSFLFANSCGTTQTSDGQAQGQQKQRELPQAQSQKTEFHEAALKKELPPDRSSHPLSMNPHVSMNPHGRKSCGWACFRKGLKVIVGQGFGGCNEELLGLMAQFEKGSYQGHRLSDAQSRLTQERLLAAEGWPDGPGG